MPRSHSDADDGIDHKRLVRFLIVIGIGIPLLIEGLTFAGLVSDHLLVGGGTDGPETGTATSTPEVERVGIGDELLADTPQNETVTDAKITATERGWVFTITVDVNNTGERGYDLTLESVTTMDGKRVSEPASVTVAPGERQTLTASWTLPEAKRPDSIAVIAVRQGDGNQSDSTTARQVPVERFPVRNR